MEEISKFVDQHPLVTLGIFMTVWELMHLFRRRCCCHQKKNNTVDRLPPG